MNGSGRRDRVSSDLIEASHIGLCREGGGTLAQIFVGLQRAWHLVIDRHANFLVVTTRVTGLRQSVVGMEQGAGGGITDGLGGVQSHWEQPLTLRKGPAAPPRKLCAKNLPWQKRSVCFINYKS